ncbi:Hypothetical protein D9617_2g056450 [Elsinoe fawcettii]|nr:Hypothetical protein D9617_2g056450 [Elsinoe fawcettii]
MFELFKLPRELLSIVTSFVPVDSILNFALSCKILHSSVKPRLAANKEKHSQYKVQHDRLPLHVPELLRLMLRDPEVAWHIRSFDAWGCRLNWNDWKTYELESPEYETPIPGWPEAEQDRSQLATEEYFTPAELDRYRSVMKDVLHMPVDEIFEWQSSIRLGSDVPLKGLIFALASRLDRINFIAYDGEDDDPLGFLVSAIRNIQNRLRHGTVWPPGLNSLRMISICTSTDLRHPHQAFYCAPSRVATLFALPHLKILNLTLIGYVEDTTPDFELPPKSSSVEELALSCCSMSLSVITKFILASMRLRLFVSASSSMGAKDDKSIIQLLADHHGKALEHLSAENLDGHLLELRYMFPNLRVLDRLQSTALEKQRAGEGKADLREIPIDESMSTDEKVACYNLQLVELRCVLPPKLERLGFIHTSTRIPRLQLFSKAILRNVADLVEEGTFKQLKEVCLYPFRRVANTQLVHQRTRLDDPGWDEQAVQRIEATGIETHLRNSCIYYGDHQKYHRDGDHGLVEIDSNPDPRAELEDADE